MQPTKSYINTTYKFGTLCKLDKRNSAAKYGYTYRLTLNYNINESWFYNFCTELFGYCIEREWVYDAEDERWLLDFDTYEYFFKYYDDFENIKMYFALTLE